MKKKFLNWNGGQVRRVVIKMITDIDKETIGKYLQRELGGKLVADYDNGNRKRYARIEEFDNIRSV